MKRRDYYSTRTGKITETPEITWKVLKKLFMVSYDKLIDDGYFQKYFGYYCVDQGEVNGELGNDINSMIFLGIKKEGFWPLSVGISHFNIHKNRTHAKGKLYNNITINCFNNHCNLC